VVADEGPGIPPELHERIFDRFFRADTSRTRATGGSGLGLAIAREIVLAHSGSIEVEVNQPRGSRFRVRLPNDRH
jgi:two-component system OmpR family sensor kinase